MGCTRLGLQCFILLGFYSLNPAGRQLKVSDKISTANGIDIRFASIMFDAQFFLQVDGGFLWIHGLRNMLDNIQGVFSCTIELRLCWFIINLGLVKFRRTFVLFINLFKILWYLNLVRTALAPLIQISYWSEWSFFNYTGLIGCGS